MRRLIDLVLLLTLAVPLFASGTREQLAFDGRNRTVYFFIPMSLAPDRPAPLILLLHGSGRNGRVMIDEWYRLAEKQGIALAAPDALNGQSWDMPADGPDFLQAVADAARKKTAIDDRRIYLFGHSAGAIFVLTMSMMESNYFAAGALHAGAYRQAGEFRAIDYVQRKIPIYMTAGDHDTFFPLDDVHATAGAMQKAGVPVTVVPMPNHDHDYYAVSAQVNERAWAFLKDKALETAPDFRKYNFGPR